MLLLCDVGEGCLYDSTPVLVHGELPGLGQDLVEHLHHLLPSPALEIFLNQSINTVNKERKKGTLPYFASRAMNMVASPRIQ